MHDDWETDGSPNPSPSIRSLYQMAEALTLTVISSNVDAHGAFVMVQRKTRGPLVVIPVMVVLGEFTSVIEAAAPLICDQVPVPGAAELAAMVAVPGVEQMA